MVSCIPIPWNNEYTVIWFYSSCLIQLICSHFKYSDLNLIICTHVSNGDNYLQTIIVSRDYSKYN